MLSLFFYPQAPITNYVASSIDSTSTHFSPSSMYHSFISLTVLSARAMLSQADDFWTSVMYNPKDCLFPQDKAFGKTHLSPSKMVSVTSRFCHLSSMGTGLVTQLFWDSLCTSLNWDSYEHFHTESVILETGPQCKGSHRHFLQFCLNCRDTNIFSSSKVDLIFQWSEITESQV